MMALILHEALKLQNRLDHGIENSRHCCAFQQSRSASSTRESLLNIALSFFVLLEEMSVLRIHAVTDEAIDRDSSVGIIGKSGSLDDVRNVISRALAHTLLNAKGK